MSEHNHQTLQTSAFGQSSMPEGASLARSANPPAFQLQAGPQNGNQGTEAEAGPGPYNVMVIGAPAPAEVNSGRQFQFLNAARYQGIDENTIWIVEATGFEAGGVSRSDIEAEAGAARVIFITPSSGLVPALNGIGTGKIQTMKLFSHGLAGQVTLRYGWNGQGLPNYGLSMSQIDGLRGSIFTQSPTIEFHSCNTGTDTEDGNIAKEFANQSGHDVSAWTGRTSYSEVNDGAADGDTAVGPSRADRGGGRLTGGYDMNEVYSQQVQGRVPVLTNFGPDSSFNSHIEINARLPETRTFYIPRNGTVRLSMNNPGFIRPNRAVNDNDEITVILRESINNGLDEHHGEVVVKPAKGQIARFSSVPAGTYYFEIIKRSAEVNPYETFYSDISVQVQ